MNQFVLKQSTQSNFGQVQLPEYNQQQPKQTSQSLGVDFPDFFQNNDTHDFNINIAELPSKVQNVNVEYKNLIPNNEYGMSNQGLIQGTSSNGTVKDQLGILRETKRHTPDQVKKYIPEDYLYGDSQHTAFKQGQLTSVGQEYIKQVPHMVQARINDTVKQKPTDMRRAQGEFNTNFENERRLINHDMKITKDLADFNINEEVGKKYYKRISTEALNRTDQTAARNSLYNSKPKQLNNNFKLQNLKYVPQNQSDQVKQVQQRSYIAPTPYNINTYDPTQNPCLKQFLSNIQQYQNNMRQAPQTYQSHIITKGDFNIQQNNRPQIFSRTYDPHLQGHIITKGDFNIQQNNRPQIFSRTYDPHLQGKFLLQQKGGKMSILSNQASINTQQQFHSEYNPFDFTFPDFSME